MRCALAIGATTALLLVDPYNDFLPEGGKVWPRNLAPAALSGISAGPH